MSAPPSDPSRAWPRILVTASLVSFPTLGHAHDAFGDLGPFHASLLHPVADPLQAALLVGTAAFLAGRQLPFVQVAFPLFFAMSGLAALALALGLAPAEPVSLAPYAVLLIGLAAVAPKMVKPRFAAFALVAVTGALTGLAPGVPASDTMLQWFFGTVSGIAALALLAWFALEAIARHATSVAPKVAGSWVAAIGILVAAFTK